MAFPASEERRVWDALLGVFRADPTLVAGSVTVSTLADGYPPGGPPLIPATTTQQGTIPLELYPDPAGGRLPMLRLVLRDFRAKRIHENQHEVTMNLDMELFVEGTDEADLMDFAGVVRSAILPTDPARKAAVDAAFSFPFFVRGRLDRQMGAPLVVGQAAHGLKATGQLSLVVHVNTS